MKKIFLSVFMISICSTAPASAQDMNFVDGELDRYSSGRSTSSSDAAVPEKKKHAFEVGMETYSYKYKETVGGEHFMDNKGSYQGLFGTYTFRPADMDSVFNEVAANIYRAEVRYAAGKVDYNGGYTDGVTVTPYTQSGLKDYVVELRGIAGREYAWRGGWGFTPYMGVGVRYLNDGAEAIPGGYNRESRYLYLPLGFTINKALRSGWGVAWNAEYDVFLQGKQTSHMEDIDPAFDPLVNKQKRGYGLRTSLKIEKDMPRFNLSVEPFYRFWHIEPSTTDPIIYAGTYIVGAGHEPENTTQEVGIKMAVGF